MAHWACVAGEIAVRRRVRTTLYTGMSLTDFTAGDGSTLVRAMDAALGENKTPGGSTQNKTPGGPNAARSTPNATITNRTILTPGGDRTMTPDVGADKTTVTPALEEPPVDDDETQDPNADMEGKSNFRCFVFKGTVDLWSYINA